MQRFRLIVILLVAVLLLVIILQNMEPVVTRILFLTVTMPRAALLFITAAAGFIIGIIVPFTLRRRS